MPGKGNTDAVFALRMLIEKYREGQRELHYVCIRRPRESLRQGSAGRTVVLYEKNQELWKSMCDLYTICMREAK